jgi:hypothetical protein
MFPQVSRPSASKTKSRGRSWSAAGGAQNGALSSSALGPTPSLGRPGGVGEQKNSTEPTLGVARLAFGPIRARIRNPYAGVLVDGFAVGHGKKREDIDSRL